ALLMVGDGAEKARLARRRNVRGLGNVIMLDQQSKGAMPAIWGVADVGLVLLRRADLFKTVIPSKIFEIMAMRKPIVMGVEGEAREIVMSAKCGICIEPGNAQHLADALIHLSRENAEARQMGERGGRFVAEHFDRTTLARRFLAVLQTVERRRPAH